MVPVKSTGTWGMSAMLDRRMCRGSCSEGTEVSQRVHSDAIQLGNRVASHPISGRARAVAYLGNVQAIKLDDSSVDLRQAVQAANHAGLAGPSAPDNANLYKTAMATKGVLVYLLPNQNTSCLIKIPAVV